MLDRLNLRGGDMGDYAALAPFHYLRQAPGTASRVLAIEDHTPSIAERFARLHSEPGRAGPVPPSSNGTVVAVLVESFPVLNCTLRDEATGGRYRGWARREAARLINAELRCISRVVVHPQWRGLGLAVRLVRHALATATTPHTEALAAMGRVHPFFALAGMTEYRRWPLPNDQRLRDALASCGVELWQLASVTQMLPAVEASPLLRAELARWAGRGLPVMQQLELARERLLVEPVYYLWSRQ